MVISGVTSSKMVGSINSPFPAGTALPPVSRVAPSFSLLDIAEHGLVVLLRNDRANLGAFIQRIAAAYLRAFNQLLAEIFMDRTFNQ
jgi:hypothetical protein